MQKPRRGGVLWSGGAEITSTWFLCIPRAYEL